tara:strand:- start:2610 stop:2984 length:375 start_codon:yes stop_codon:yes gene_type:complete
MYLVYIITSGNRSYIGMTNDFFRRWKQHNKIIKGGAKYTRYNYWSPICIIDGFNTKSEAMQCEWKLKRVKGIHNRIMNLVNIITNEQRWTKKSPLIKDQMLTYYIINQYKGLFNNHTTKELEWF